VPLKPAPAPRREAAPATAPDAAAPAPPARLTLVGVMDGIGAPQAIVQDVEFGLAQTVRVGEEVFAHRVTRITAEEVTLERNGATRTLRLGGEKADGRIEELSDGLNLQLSDPRNAALASLPSNVILTLARLMPRQGTLKRVRTEVRDGQRVHEVERDIEGRDYEIHLGDNGQVIQIEQELQRTDLPPAVLAAANSAVPGYKINPGDNPKLWDRDGRRYYEVEIRQEGGEAEIDLQISPEGKIIGRG